MTRKRRRSHGFGIGRPRFAQSRIPTADPPVLEEYISDFLRDHGCFCSSPRLQVQSCDRVIVLPISLSAEGLQLGFVGYYPVGDHGELDRIGEQDSESVHGAW